MDNLDEQYSEEVVDLMRKAQHYFPHKPQDPCYISMHLYGFDRIALHGAILEPCCDFCPLEESMDNCSVSCIERHIFA